jgi:HlyD family secretion protein
MIKKLVVTLIVIFLSGTIVWHFLNNRQREVIYPVRSTVIQAVYATGEVEPVYWSKIATQIPGKIEEIFVSEGDAVKENEELAKLEDTVECTKASEYLANLHFLEKEKERYKTLSEDGYAASKQQYERIVSEYEAAQARLEAQNQLVDRMTIKSPIDGVILKRDVESGETITLSDVIFWVGKLQPLRITAEVDEEDIALVKTGQKVLVKADAFPETSIEGVVSEITPKGDPIDKNFRVRIALPDDTPLMVGMTVEVNVIAKTIENALVVPTGSVIDEKVWVKKGRKFVEHPVQTGISNEKQVQILGGISEEDEILMDPSDIP